MGEFYSSVEKQSVYSTVPADWASSLQVSEFKLQFCYYIHFQTTTIEKGMNPHIPPAMG